MIAKVYSAIPQGYDGRIVEVEGDTNKGLPCFNIVGMANKTIFEARERVRSAISNSGLIFPQKKVTINLAPAELAKDGSHLDLPIALAILVLSQQLLVSDLDNRLFVGELSLNGETKPVRGIINIVEAAKNAGYREIFVPRDNFTTARLIPGIKVTGVDNLFDLTLTLKGLKSVHSKKVVQNHPTPRKSSVVKNTRTENNSQLTLDNIRGQNLAKRALIIALAGHHNLLLSGSPGAGKTLLDRTAANLLPPPSPSEKIEIAKIHSLIYPSEISVKRPFRAPHHTSSVVALIGGGTKALPGEISLAHRGVLFLDELPEYPRRALESLRQPLEDGKICLARANQHAIYPADFILIATMNPCPCGYLGSKTHPCSCTHHQIESYRKRLSGPILDRIDMILDVHPVSCQDLVIKHADTVVKNTKTDINTLSEQEKAQKIIKNATKLQAKRYKNTFTFNSSLSPKDITEYIKIHHDAEQILQLAADKMDLSTRSYFRTLKVAQTIADLDEASEVKPEHISEALSFRVTSN